MPLGIQVPLVIINYPSSIIKIDLTICIVILLLIISIAVLLSYLYLNEMRFKMDNEDLTEKLNEKQQWLERENNRLRTDMVKNNFY